MDQECSSPAFGAINLAYATSKFGDLALPGSENTVSSYCLSCICVQCWEPRWLEIFPSRHFHMFFRQLLAATSNQVSVGLGLLVALLGAMQSASGLLSLAGISFALLVGVKFTLLLQPQVRADSSHHSACSDLLQLPLCLKPPPHLDFSFGTNLEPLGLAYLLGNTSLCFLCRLFLVS